MKVDFGRILTELGGKELIVNKEALTLKSVSIEALMATYQDETNLKGDEKVRRYELAEGIYNGADDVKTEDIVLLKGLIAKAYGPMVVGQAWRLLEGKG